MLVSTFIAVLVCASSVHAASRRPPHIYSQPEHNYIFYKPAETVNITCVADGDPGPTYSWNLNSFRFSPSGNDDRVVQVPNEGTIIFRSAEEKDEGVYQCFATNDYGVSASNLIAFRQAQIYSTMPTGLLAYHVFVGNSLTLPCIPPRCSPPCDISWMIRDHTGDLTALNLDKRVTMDLEGRLMFVNTLPSDELAGKTYACVASNSVLPKTQIISEYSIRVHGTTAHQSPVSELWTSPGHFAVRRGETLRLKCIFLGNPTPDVWFEKLNDQLPNRTNMVSFGQELQISDVHMSDAGQYRCMGNNSDHKTSEKIFTVDVRSAPYWIHKPEITEGYMNGNVTITCEAGGAPPPEYIWYINSVEYHKVTDPGILNNPRIIKTDNTLTITDLTLDDRFNIQCNASNVIDYVFADVYLNVKGPGIVPVG